MLLALFLLLQSFAIVMLDRVGGTWQVVESPDIVLNRSADAGFGFAVTIPDGSKPVKLSMVGLPGGVKATVKPDECKVSCTVDVTLTAAKDAPTGDYRPAFQGSANSIQSQLIFNLTVR